MDTNRKENKMKTKRLVVAWCVGVAAIAVACAAPAMAGDKPNIVVIWGDDIGQSNISAYTHGLMG
jgi:arylsulfatase